MIANTTDLPGVAVIVLALVFVIWFLWSNKGSR